MDLIDYQSDVNAFLAVLVLYKTRLEDSETFVSLSNSLKNSKLTMDVMVYDNSPTPMVTAPECINDNWIIHYIHDKTNPGISKAYNAGFGIAGKLNKKWLLLLDQDTSFPPNAIIEYSKTVRENPGIFLFAPIVMSRNMILSPCRYFLNRGYSLRTVTAGIHNFKRKSLINSGMLVHVEAFKRVDGYNENIRLDFADHFFIDKYKANYSNFVVINLWCSQGFSGKQCLTLDLALVRFALYCEGARNKAVNKLDYCVLMVVIILRSTHLSLKYTNVRFFRVAIEVFWAGKITNAAK